MDNDEEDVRCVKCGGVFDGGETDLGIMCPECLQEGLCMCGQVGLHACPMMDRLHAVVTERREMRKELWLRIMTEFTFRAMRSGNWDATDQGKAGAERAAEMVDGWAQVEQEDLGGEDSDG